MKEIYRQILEWSEVWALLIPLAFMLIYKNETPYLRPIRIFVWVFLFLNLFIDIIANKKEKLGITENDFLWNNNFVYNITSIIRFFIFGWFFNALHQKFLLSVKKLTPYIFIIFVLANFVFFQNFIPQGYEPFSSRLLATEGGLILFYCLQYFIYLIREDKTAHIRLQPGFWVVTGLSIYMAASFFIFLFYEYLAKNYPKFADAIWDVHNITFILLCIFIGKQFHQEHKTKP